MDYYSYPDYYDYGYSSAPTPDSFASRYSSDSFASGSSDIAALGGTIVGTVLGIGLAIGFIIAIIQIIAMWRLFTKAGQKGWKSIIPIYNVVTLFKISGISPWIIFGYLAGFIPFVGWIVCFAITIYQANSLAKSFGKDVGYTIGLIFLPSIFYLILGFGKSEYVGNGAFSTSSNYQGDGVVNITEKQINNNNDDNFNL